MTQPPLEPSDRNPIRVLITAGPTREPIDPVRFISNASSGRQGVALAECALKRGWQVDFVHGPLEVEVPRGIDAHAVTTTAEMLEACRRRHPDCDALIGAAAVSDFRPQAIADRKQKRGFETWLLQLTPTTDILAKLGELKGDRVHVGFALESEDLELNANRKLERKNLDWIVANEPAAIGAQEARYLLLGKNGFRKDLGSLTKEALAERIVAQIARDLTAV